MLHYTDKQQREVFHLLFLQRLLKASQPTLYVLKGGVNLRFFFQSPRYSEDMDLDVLGGSVESLKKNGYKILQDAAFQRVLRTFGIEEVQVNDPAKAKQTETTQRFRARLVTQSGESFPTKIEFSRRALNKRQIRADFASEIIAPEIVAPYRRLSFPCQHYLANAAINQKLRALAGRALVQARDPFDLYILYLGGYIPRDYQTSLSPVEREAARGNLANLSYSDYQGQVIDYLSSENAERFKAKAEWNRITEIAMDLLEREKS